MKARAPAMSQASALSRPHETRCFITVIMPLGYRVRAWACHHTGE